MRGSPSVGCERGDGPSRIPGTALLDGLIAAVCARIGALLVTANLRDFEALAEELPFRVGTLDALGLPGIA